MRRSGRRGSADSAGAPAPAAAAGGGKREGSSGLRGLARRVSDVARRAARAGDKPPPAPREGFVDAGGAEGPALGAAAAAASPTQAAARPAATASPRPPPRLTHGEVADAVSHAFSWLDWAGIAQCERVCSQWRRLLSDPLWYTFAKDCFPENTLDASKYGGSWKALCRDGNLRNQWLVVPLAPRTVCWWRWNLGPQRYYECQIRWIAITHGAVEGQGPLLRLCVDTRGEGDLWTTRTSTLEGYLRPAGPRAGALMAALGMRPISRRAAAHWVHLAVHQVGREAGYVDFRLNDFNSQQEMVDDNPLYFSFNGHEFYDAVPLPITPRDIVQPTFEDQENDVSTLKLVHGFPPRIQWWANGNIEEDCVHQLQWIEGDKKICVPGHWRLQARIISHDGPQLEALLHSIADLAAIAKVHFQGFRRSDRFPRRSWVTPRWLRELGTWGQHRPMREKGLASFQTSEDMRSCEWCMDPSWWADNERAQSNSSWGGGDVRRTKPQPCPARYAVPAPGAAAGGGFGERAEGGAEEAEA